MKTIILDAARMKTRDAVHAYLKEALQLPTYYGENLDALNDCLGEISEDTAIVVPKIITQTDYLGDYGKIMLQVFTAAAKENSYLTVSIN